MDLFTTATGATLSLGSYWKESNGLTAALSTTNANINTLYYQVITASHIDFNLVKNGVV
jgi:hypothetical protein